MLAAVAVAKKAGHKALEEQAAVVLVVLTLVLLE
jgi:hypothetical protein